MAFRVAGRGRRATATTRSASSTAPIRSCPGRFKDYISTPEAERLPLAAHRRDRAGAAAHRGADPHPRDARDRRARRRRALDLQAAGRPRSRRAAIPLAARAARHPRARVEARGIPRAHQARDVPGPGLLLHAQGRPDRAAARRDAGRLRLRGALARSATPASAPRSTAACVPLRTQLQNGDQVEIVTSKAQTPVADLGALRRHRQGARPHPPLRPHPAARAVSRARPRDAAEGVPAARATSSPSRPLEACSRDSSARRSRTSTSQVGEGIAHRRARSSTRSFPAAAPRRKDKVVPISRARAARRPRAATPRCRSAA